MRQAFAVTCLLAGAALAQIPGQYPGGQYPGGQYPGGQTRGRTPIPRIPIPGTGNPNPQPTNRTPQPEQTTRSSRTSIAATTRDTSGIMRQLSRGELIIESNDHRIIWYRIGDNLVDTKALDSEKFHPGDHLTVTSKEDDQGRYTAVSVQWESAATEEDKIKAAQTWDMPNNTDIQAQAQAPTQSNPDRDERPKLRRASPPAESAPAKEPEPAAAARTSDRIRTGPMPTHPDEPAIVSAREAAGAFMDSLPSFAAKQNTTRYIQEGARSPWRAQDIVSADLVYRNGAEEYTNIKVNNKASNKPLEEIDGLRSTGEFGSILAEIFDPEAGTEFSRPVQVDMRGHRAWKYKFDLPRERSDFRVITPSQLYYTGYGGTLWIDFETNRVLRLEMQATNLPKAFPFDTVEMTIDYDYIRLDSSKQFLLPTESEALNCIRGTTICMKNAMSFRNYVKFTSDSSIIFDAPQQ